MSSKDPVEQNVIGVQSLVGSKTNKMNAGVIEQKEGVASEPIDALTLDMEDAELIKLANRWTLKYSTYESKLKPRWEANKTYYLGRQKEGGSDVENLPISSNLLFEAEETFLPAALSKNPEPVVWCDNTEEGNKVASDVKTMLQYHADILVLRRKLMLMTRHWSIYFIGVIKHGWDAKIGDIKSDVIDPRNLILDPDCAIDSYGDYEGKYIGERKTCSAEDLIGLFPKHKDIITLMVDGLLGTSVTYTEWNTDEYQFFTFRNIVLDKNKNPHFNHPQPKIEMDAFGVPQQVEVKGNNHFSIPKKPYTFLAVFTLGEQPHDVTGLIEQNIPNQRRITRRTEQIDYNLSRANNSDVFSADNFNQETAKQAARALRKGDPVLVPKGKAISEAIARLQAPGIGADFFTELQTSKTDLKSIFGTEGISSQKPDENTTARGMILNQQFDNTRIGGGIGDALEQVADNIFNWWVQLYKVYYDEEHFAAVMGRMKAVEYVTFSAQNLNRRIVVSVSPDSMKPKDEITEMNQALALWDKAAIDPKTLLTLLNVPDPQKTAENTVLWTVDKNAYMQLNFPELYAKIQQVQMQAQQQMMMAAQGGAPQKQPGPATSVMPDRDDDTAVDIAPHSLSQVPINSQAVPQ